MLKCSRNFYRLSTLLVFLTFMMEATAQTAPPAGAPPQGSWMTMIMMFLMLGALWFLMIRPQAKRAKEHRALLDSLKPGDPVVFSGIYGKVVSLDEGTVMIEIAPNTIVKAQKPAILAVLPDPHKEGFSK